MKNLLKSLGITILLGTGCFVFGILWYAFIMYAGTQWTIGVILFTVLFMCVHTNRNSRSDDDEE